MAIVDQTAWLSCVNANRDAYGKCCVDVARRVMLILDEEPGEIDCHSLICRADVDTNAGGITGFMAGCVAEMVSKVHSRGEEFRRKWNIDTQISDEGKKANETGRILNPALMNIG